MGNTGVGNWASGGVGFWAKGGRKMGILLIYKLDLQENDLQEYGLQRPCRRQAAHRRVCDLGFFDWEKTTQDFAKFTAIPCPREQDRQFLFKVLAASQRTIPAAAVWDALAAVKAIRPRVPMAYFRTVLADNCRKAGVNLAAVLKSVRVPSNRLQPKSPKPMSITATIGVLPHLDDRRTTQAEVMQQLAMAYHAERSRP
jgi:hypothetical protein